MMTYVGKIAHVIFRSDDTGYTVAVMDVDNPKCPRERCITIVGNALSIRSGMKVKVEGSWITHSKFGDQFKFISLVPMLPIATKVKDV